MLTALFPYRQLLSKCPPSIANGFDLIRTKEICANDRTRNESRSIGLGFIFCVAWMSYRFKPWLDEHVTKLRRALANQQGGVEREQPKLSRPLLRPESEVFEMSKVSGTFLTETPLVGSWPLGWSELPCVCVFQLGLAEIEVVNGTYWEFSSSSEVHRRKRISPVGWRGAPRNSWGQRTPRGLAGARCLRDCSSKSSRRAIQ